MNVLFTQTISAGGWFTLLAARTSEGDDTVWTQILVVVILAVSFGIFSLAKAKANKSNKSKEEDLPASAKFSNVAGPASPHRRRLERQVNLSKKRTRDLQSGMEILDSDFLLKVVENSDNGGDEKDVTMRKLNFKELLRRGGLNQADSKALKTYALNKGNLYGKDIQCEAIRILAERTAKGKPAN